MGMVERGGKVYLKHVPDTSRWTLIKQIKENVAKGADIYTDEFSSYTGLHNHGYYHDWVTHAKFEYARGEVHTQNIENIWSQLKRGITGVYRKVSKKYLQAYADEYAWRYNHRHFAGQMFEKLLQEVVEVKTLKAVQPVLAK